MHDDELDPHILDDVKETGTVQRAHERNPEEENSNDTEFGLAGLSLTAAATSGKGLPPLEENDPRVKDVTTWEADHTKDTWK
jgi:hypothetical protein